MPKQSFAKIAALSNLGTSPQNFSSGNKIKLLDMRTSDSWILDASYRDPTIVRNIISHDMFRDMHPKNIGLPNGQSAIRGHIVEAIVNNIYAGTFILEEKPDRALVGLKAANGSVMYKADFNNQPTTHPGVSVNNVFFNANAKTLLTNFSLLYPKTDNTANRAALVNFANFVATADDTTFINKIGNLIDLNSLVDWWLLVLAEQGSDNTSKNFILAKNAGGKFFMVPWDHDSTFSEFWNGAVEPASTYFDPSNTTIDNNLIKRLLQNPETLFATKMKARWPVLRKSIFTKAKILARFNTYGTQLAIGGAKQRNATLWPPTTLKKSPENPFPALAPNPKIGTINYIGSFCDVRLPAMDSYISNL